MRLLARMRLQGRRRLPYIKSILEGDHMQADIVLLVFQFLCALTFPPSPPFPSFGLLSIHMLRRDLLSAKSSLVRVWRSLEASSSLTPSPPSLLQPPSSPAPSFPLINYILPLNSLPLSPFSRSFLALLFDPQTDSHETQDKEPVCSCSYSTPRFLSERCVCWMRHQE